MTTLKGLPRNEPYLELLGVGDYRFNGLIESSDAEAFRQRSEWMWSQGLATERIDAVYDLESVPDRLGVRSIETYKKMLLAQLKILRERDSDLSVVRIARDRIPEEDYPVLEERIRDARFIAIRRSMPFGLRCDDFTLFGSEDLATSASRLPDETYVVERSQVSSPEAVLGAYKARFEAILKAEAAAASPAELASRKRLFEAELESLRQNMQSSLSKPGGADVSSTHRTEVAYRALFNYLETQGGPKLNAERLEDVQQFLGDTLPTNMATYLAKLHGLDVVHGFAHGQNWIASGTALVDLDSMTGRPFGDPKPDPAAFLNDVQRTLGAIETQLGVRALGRFPTKETVLRQIMGGEAFDALQLQAKATFVGTYLAKVGADASEVAATLSGLAFNADFAVPGREDYESAIRAKVSAVRGSGG